MKYVNMDKIYYFVYRFLFDWIELICAIIGIATFGFVHVKWVLYYAAWYAGFTHKRKEKAYFKKKFNVNLSKKHGVKND